MVFSDEVNRWKCWHRLFEDVSNTQGDQIATILAAWCIFDAALGIVVEVGKFGAEMGVEGVVCKDAGGEYPIVADDWPKEVRVVSTEADAEGKFVAEFVTPGSVVGAVEVGAAAREAGLLEAFGAEDKCVGFAGREGS